MTLGRFRIEAGFVLLLTLLVYLDRGRLLWVVLISALLHELGHWLVLRLLGGRVSGMVLSAGGFNMQQADTPCLSYGRELCAVLAGPLASFGAAFLFSLGGSDYSAYVGMCFSHGLFNLLPAEGLDGGRILSLLLDKSGCLATGRVLRIATVTTLLLLTLLGYAVLRRSQGNASLLLAVVYAACTGVSLDPKNEKTKAFPRTLTKTPHRMG